MNPIARSYAAYLFDLDGTLWTGADLYDGAADVIRLLAARNRRVVVVSNNSVLTGNGVVENLAAFGLVAGLQAVTVTDVAGEFLRAHCGACAVRVVGAPALSRGCREQGHDLVDLWDPGAADAVLLGRDDSFSYRTLTRLAACVERGERFFVTNEDAWHPGPHGSRVPETGALLAAVQAVRPSGYASAGKPGPLLFRRAIELAGVECGDALMVGDHPLMDIDGASRAGIDSVWISFGRPYPADAGIRPLESCASIRELADILGAPRT